MSYDILFVPRAPGQDWDEALDAAESTDAVDVPLGPERLEQWQRIVTVLQRRLGGVEVSDAPDVCEATATDGTGLQVSLFPDEAAVTFPYRRRPDPAAFHDLVVDVVGLVERETGLHAWDAQSDRPFDGHVHDEVGLEATERLRDEHGGDDVTPDVTPDDVTPDDVTREAQPDAGAATVVEAAAPDTPRVWTPEELARDRTRAIRYLVIGTVIIVAAVLLRQSGESSTLSGLAIAIGVFDLVLGVALLQSWRRRSRDAG